MFFTADTHFLHRNIIALCRRPFADVDAMNAALVSLWNERVGRNDDVWHVGDFACGSGSGARAAIFDRLNGHKRLVIGNHDDRSTLDLSWAEAPVHLAELKTQGMRFVLCHYGLRVWPGMHRGAVNLYGHSHGRLPGNSLSLDVGVDAWAYRPASLDEIRLRLEASASFEDPERR